MPNREPVRQELPPVMVFDRTEDRNWPPKLGLSYGAVFADSASQMYRLVLTWAEL